jgi:hypothetical protein
MDLLPATQGMEAVPLHLREANQFVARHHRHNNPAAGGKFAHGVAQGGKPVGIAVAGRPVCRRLDDGRTLEVLRVCTDGTPNSYSFLYSRCARIARLMGYERVITYTLESEGGAPPCGRSGPGPPAHSSRTSGATPTGPARVKPFTTSRNTAGSCEQRPLDWNRHLASAASGGSYLPALLRPPT